MSTTPADTALAASPRQRSQQASPSLVVAAVVTLNLHIFLGVEGG